MTQATANPAVARLTAAQVYDLHNQKIRRDAAVERQRQEIQGDMARLADLYANGSLKRKQAAPEPQFKEAVARTVTRLAGGLAASVAADKAKATRRARVLDDSPEAVAKREQRRTRRAARKLRQAAAQG